MYGSNTEGLTQGFEGIIRGIQIDYYYYYHQRKKIEVYTQSPAIYCILAGNGSSQCRP